MQITSLFPADHVRNLYAISVPADVALKDLQDGKAWTHVAAQLHRNDRVEVTRVDGAFYAEFHVLAASKNWAKVHLIRHVDLSKVEVGTSPESFHIKWGNDNTKFRIHRTTDKSVIKDGFESKEHAQAWIDEFARGGAALL